MIVEHLRNYDWYYFETLEEASSWYKNKFGKDPERFDILHPLSKEDLCGKDPLPTHKYWSATIERK